MHIHQSLTFNLAPLGPPMGSLEIWISTESGTWDFPGLEEAEGGKSFISIESVIWDLLEVKFINPNKALKNP